MQKDTPNDTPEEIQDTTPPTVSEEEKEDEERSKDNAHLFTPAAILIAAAMISGTLLYTGGIESRVPSEVLVGQAGSVVDDGGGGAPTITIAEDDHILGSADAAVTIVEFSDFQCPFCSRFHPTLKQAMAEYEGQVRWVYKHFPLSQIHPEAVAAAEASECVTEQKGNDGFWQFGDQLFENQQSLGVVLYRELAEGIGLDMTQFNTCISQRKYKDKVEEDYALGIQLGITGTPGSFINNIPLRGAVPYENVKAAIESELSQI